MKKVMWITALATALIFIGVTLLILCSIPMKNTLEGNTLTVKYIIGHKAIDMTDAHFMPVPEETQHNIIRIGGTSIGKKHSGNYMNYKTKTKYKFYLTGNGEQSYFEIGDVKYLVDGIK
jgi:hypothetical protein